MEKKNNKFNILCFTVFVFFKKTLLKLLPVTNVQFSEVLLLSKAYDKIAFPSSPRPYYDQI